jgi:hypothetical protein
MKRAYNYITERRHLSKTNVLCSADERLLDRSKDATLKSRLTFAPIYENATRAEVGLAAVVEVFVGVAQLVQVVCSLGSLRIR